MDSASAVYATEKFGRELRPAYSRSRSTAPAESGDGHERNSWWSLGSTARKWCRLRRGREKKSGGSAPEYECSELSSSARSCSSKGAGAIISSILGLHA